MTMPQPFPVNPNYLTVICGLLEMHRLSAQDLFESPQADAVRDAMDVPWQGLSAIERKRLAGLSEDLNAMSETTSAPAPQELNHDTQAKLVQVYEARKRGEWDKALELLRQWGKDAPLALASYVRGTIWRAAGDMNTAIVFFEHASRLEPENCFFRGLQDLPKPADPVEASRGA